MKEGKDGRHENQSRHGCAEQASNHGASERRILFSTIAKAECHRHHANDHGKRCHNYRTEPRVACFDGGLYGVPVFCQSLLRKRNHKDAVRSGHPDAHEGSHKGRHAQRGTGEEEHEHDAPHSRGKRSDDDEGVEPGLKVHHDKHVDKNDGSRKPGNEPRIGLVHGVNLTTYGDEGPARKSLPIPVDDARNIAACGFKIAVLDCSIDIDYAADIVVREYRHLVSPLHGSDISENLRISLTATSDGNILNILYRLNSVLGGLGHQVVVHAVSPVDQEHRRNLKTSAQCVQCALRNLLFGIAGLGCLGAVDRDLQRRIVEWLLDVQISRTGNAAHVGHHILRYLMTELNIVAFDLHIDGRRKAKVQNLSHHVGGQK